MLKLFKYFKTKEWFFLSICLALIITQVWLDMTLPDYMQGITTVLQTQTGGVPEILKNGGMMLLCAAGSCFSAIFTGFFGAQIAAGFSQTLRGAIFRNVQDFSMAEINKFSTASLITRSTNDVTQIQLFIAMGLQIIIKAPITAIWALSKILQKGAEFGAATGVAIAFLLIIFTILIIVVLPKFKKIQKLTDNLNASARENLTGMRVVRAFNAESYQEEKFDKANTELNKTNLFAQRSMAILQPSMSLLMGGLTLAIYWIGAYIIHNNPQNPVIAMTTFNNMIVFMSYAMQIIMSFMMLAIVFIMLPRAAVSSGRIREVLKTKSSVKDGTPSRYDISTDGGEIEFCSVSFKYGGASENVLENISFKIKKGETVAFIGSTGSGKSTLINLVPRFFDATEGQIFIDGKKIKDYALKDLRNKIGYVSQTAVLFSGTVEENIVFGESANEISKEDVAKAMEIAQASEFVNNLEQKTESRLAQGGKNLSGGQKQRLAIARAIAKKPQILIFDDSFSALDYKTDKILRKSLKKEMAGVTKLIVAQRIGTIMDADKIIVLEKGKTVGTGTHWELLQTCKVYQEIAYSQLSKEELK